jgi:hypothetical protein
MKESQKRRRSLAFYKKKLQDAKLDHGLTEEEIGIVEGT